MKVLIPQDVVPCGKQYLIDKGYEVVVGSGFDAETIIREGADADAILARTAPYPAEVINALPKCRIIARYGVGVDNIDLKAAEEKGIYVTAAKNCNHISVAEHAMTMALALSKNLEYLDLKQRADAVNNYGLRNKANNMELTGKTLAIIGLGRIGLELARMMHFALNMKVIGYDAYADLSKLPEYVQPTTLENCFREGDVISLHVPATAETINMINTETIGMMKSSAILINCARGGIVNEADLYEALKAGRIHGAGLDVFVNEPTEADNALFELDNFIGSPHNAGLTLEAMDAMCMSCAHAIDDVLSGKAPMYPVNNPKL